MKRGIIEMRKLLCCMFALMLVLSALPLHADAAEIRDESEEIIYLSDGSYIEVETIVTSGFASDTTVGSKIYRGKYSGSTAWEIVLSGSFSFDGSSATCTDSGCSVSIYDSAWYTVSKSSGKSGSSATASVTMGRKAGGITVDRVPVSLKLTCDANGNLK